MNGTFRVPQELHTRRQGGMFWSYPIGNGDPGERDVAFEVPV